MTQKGYGVMCFGCWPSLHDFICNLIFMITKTFLSSTKFKKSQSFVTSIIIWSQIVCLAPFNYNLPLIFYFFLSIVCYKFSLAFCRLFASLYNLRLSFFSPFISSSFKETCDMVAVIPSVDIWGNTCELVVLFTCCFNYYFSWVSCKTLSFKFQASYSKSSLSFCSTTNSSVWQWSVTGILRCFFNDLLTFYFSSNNFLTKCFSLGWSPATINSFSYDFTCVFQALLIAFSFFNFFSSLSTLLYISFLFKYICNKS